MFVFNKKEDTMLANPSTENRLSDFWKNQNLFADAYNKFMESVSLDENQIKKLNELIITATNCSLTTD